MLQKRLRYSCSGIQSEPNPDSKSAFERRRGGQWGCCSLRGTLTGTSGVRRPGQRSGRAGVRTDPAAGCRELHPGAACRILNRRSQHWQGVGGVPAGQATSQKTSEDSLLTHQLLSSCPGDSDSGGRRGAQVGPARSSGVSGVDSSLRSTGQEQTLEDV